MQINVKLPTEFNGYADMLRRQYYGKDATRKEYRDSFVFARAIDEFSCDPAVLSKHFDRDKDTAKTQKMLTVRQNTYEKLEALSKTLDCTIAAVYRAIIFYSIENLNVLNSAPINSEIEIKAALLEKQLQDCQSTLQDILKYLRN